MLAKYDYHFDAAYQIARWAIGNQLSDFAYDRTGQLTNALNTAQPNEDFRFDANGNRVGAQSSGQYVVGGNNQILSDGTNRYAYDAEGNMTSRSNAVTGVLATYQWDHRNRLVSVLDRNSGGVVTQTVAFVYDTMNRRLSKTVSGPQNTNVVRFLYNQDDSWADLDSSNAVIARYLHGARIDELLARQRASDGRGWYLTDHLGTVRELANAAGAVVAHVDYSSFGQVLGVSNPAAVDRFLFTGRESDREVGLYFCRARYLDQNTGKFIAQDPLGFLGGDLNLFRYAHGDPLRWRDPSGCAALIEYAILVNALIVAPLALLSCGQRGVNAGAASQANGDYGDYMRHCTWFCCATRRSGFINMPFVFLWGALAWELSEYEENNREGWGLAWFDVACSDYTGAAYAAARIFHTRVDPRLPSTAPATKVCKSSSWPACPWSSAPSYRARSST